MNACATKQTEYALPIASLYTQFGAEGKPCACSRNTEYSLVSFDTLVDENSGVAFTLVPLLIAILVNYHP